MTSRGKFMGNNFVITLMVIKFISERVKDALNNMLPKDRTLIKICEHLLDQHEDLSYLSKNVLKNRVSTILGSHDCFVKGARAEGNEHYWTVRGASEPGPSAVSKTCFFIKRLQATLCNFI
jgi:hypothetical protein